MRIWKKKYNRASKNINVINKNESKSAVKQGKVNIINIK